MIDLSAKQKRILYVIEGFISFNGYSPSVRELCEICELKSTSTVHGYLDRLESKGYITRKADTPRTIQMNHDNKAKGITEEMVNIFEVLKKYIDKEKGVSY